MASAMAWTMTMTSFAGQWQQNTQGWWYQNDDGSYPSTGWQWIDGRSYYFDSRGYCLMDTVTPDGYTVNASGAWTVNGVVQVQESTAQDNSLTGTYRLTFADGQGGSNLEYPMNRQTQFLMQHSAAVMVLILEKPRELLFLIRMEVMAFGSIMTITHLMQEIILHQCY